MTPKDRERVDFLLDAVEADIEQAYIELMKARGHAITLRAAVEVVLADDPSFLAEQKP